MSDLPQDPSGSENQPASQGGFQSPDPTQQAPLPGYQPQPNPTYPPHQYQQPQYPEESGAIVALVVSILGIAVCSGLLSPVGWVLANKELAAIQEGRRDPTKRDMAKAAQVIGIIGSVLLALGLLFFVGFILIAIIGAAAGA